MNTEATQSIQDYLKAIYQLTREQAVASTTQLSEILDVKPASITGMIQKLAATDPALLQYHKHHGVALTEAGEKIALETIRHHRLIEEFLHQILGYPWDEVHEEADRLEHFISEKFEERIASALGHPSHDPHGDPIPRHDLSLPDAPGTHLSELRPPQAATIKRVRDDDPALLRHLGDMGIVPEATIKAIAYSEFDQNLSVQLDSSSEVYVLGPKITNKIYVNID